VETPPNAGSGNNLLEDMDPGSEQLIERAASRVLQGIVRKCDVIDVSDGKSGYAYAINLVGWGVPVTSVSLANRLRPWFFGAAPYDVAALFYLFFLKVLSPMSLPDLFLILLLSPLFCCCGNFVIPISSSFRHISFLLVSESPTLSREHQTCSTGTLLRSSCGTRTEYTASLRVNSSWCRLAQNLQNFPSRTQNLQSRPRCDVGRENSMNSRT